MRRLKKIKFLSILASAAMVIGLMMAPMSVSAAEQSITLEADRSDGLTVSVGENYILDLNGHNMTGKIVNNGTLTIKDTKGNGKVSVTNDHVITNNGNLTITNGTFDALSHAKGTVVNNVNAVATINGGTFIRSNEAGKDAQNSGGNSWYVLFNQGEMTINSANVSSTGHFSSLVENGWSNGNSNTTKENSMMIINGGNFTGGINTLKNDDYGDIKITNGKFLN